VAVYGDKAVAQYGHFSGRKWGFRVLDEKGVEVLYEQHANGSIDTPHARNFIDCVRSRQRPRVDIEEGHLATSLAHLGNIVARTGRGFAYDGAGESIPGDAEANKLVRRPYRQHWSTPRG
jgi:hypothetical protein